MTGSHTASRIFLDHNSTTRPPSEVLDTVAWHARETFANPGSRHADGRAARRVLEDARETLADILGAEPREIVFTSGGTEAINLALLGLGGGRPGTALLTAGEHPASLQACRALERQGWNLRFLGVDSKGRLSVERLDEQPWDDVRLATLILAHNETGVVQDVRPLADRCRQRGIPLHLDAVQAVGKIDVDFHELGVAALSLGAHKFHGPRGVGALLVRENRGLVPRQLGGHQESDRRAGTESVALVAGMALALKMWHDERDSRRESMQTLRDRLERGLAATCEPVVVNGSIAHRLPNTSNIAFSGVDGEALLVALDLAGVSCSLGSTCASGSSEPSPVFQSMGCSPEIASSSVRFSVSFENTIDEIDEAVGRVADCVGRLRRSALAANRR